MSKLQTFLDSLEDYELLALYKYRYESFMKGSKSKIIGTIKKRKLNIEEIDEHIERAKCTAGEIKDSVCCPRCYSRRFYHKNELDKIHNAYYYIEITNSFRTCIICCFSQEKKEYGKEKRSFWGRLKSMINLNN